MFISIIQVRLSSVLKMFVGDTQRGFRSKQSKVEPLFCAHRLTELAARGTDPLCLIFLDWEKAFDKINHEKMFQSVATWNSNGHS